MAAAPRGTVALRYAAAPLAVLALLAAAAPARSADAPPAPESAWEVNLAPYLWLSGLRGDIGVNTNTLPAHISVSFGQVVEALKFGLMLGGDVRHGRFVGMGDLVYVDVQTSTHVGVRDPEFLNVRLTNKQLISTVLGGYRALDGADRSLDLLAGGRIVSLDNRLDLEAGDHKLSGSGSKTWIDPVVGVRFRGPIAPRWSYTLYGDVGGSGQVTWQALGLVNFAASPNWTVTGGWRHLVLDHRDNGFLFNVAMDGPLLGANYRF